MMNRNVAERCIKLLEMSPSVKTLDITGGAPELNENFRYMVTEGRRLGKEVIDRCNLTVLSEPGQEDLGSFLAENKVRVVASLPCYSAKNVDIQRGSGVFSRSIRGLLLLNQLGYGQEGSGLILDLVYNPLGAFLPPEQSALEATYRRQLEADFGISFNNLFTLTNMPIKRFADQLARRDELVPYMDLLVRNFNPAACGGLMCLDLVSVDHRGALYDCDFNQQLATRMVLPRTVFDVASLDELVAAPVATDSHCFGCTAGMGSSCQGATA
jgi:radical SAM/Cys-rich protein